MEPSRTVKTVLDYGDPVRNLLVLADGKHRIVAGGGEYGVWLQGDKPVDLHEPASLVVIGRVTNRLGE